MTKFLSSAALVLGCFTLSTAAFAQDESRISNSSVIGQNYLYPTSVANDAPVTGETDILIETGVFFKNLELIDLGDLDGQTYFGFIAPVRLRHQLTDIVSVELGAVVGQNFGDDDTLSDIDPHVRLVVRPKEDVVVVAGTLIPTHWAHQGVFDDTNKFRDLTEQGFQIRADHTNFKHDSWINWRIEEGAIDAEEFEIGSTSQLRLMDDTLRLNGEVVWSHAGGQISTSRQVIPKTHRAKRGPAGKSGGIRTFALDRVQRCMRPRAISLIVMTSARRRATCSIISRIIPLAVYRPFGSLTKASPLKRARSCKIQKARRIGRQR